MGQLAGRPYCIPVTPPAPARGGGGGRWQVRSQSESGEPPPTRVSSGQGELAADREVSSGQGTLILFLYLQ